MFRLTAHNVRKAARCERAIPLVEGSSGGNIRKVGCRARFGREEDCECCVHGGSCPEGRDPETLRNFIIES